MIGHMGDALCSLMQTKMSLVDITVFFSGFICPQNFGFENNQHVPPHMLLFFSVYS
jgi:hypothetical protein